LAAIPNSAIKGFRGT